MEGPPQSHPLPVSDVLFSPEWAIDGRSLNIFR